jgi:hypothetical protein
VHGAGDNGQNRLEKACLGPDKEAISGQDVLVGLGIIGRQGAPFMDVIGDQVIEHERFQTQKSQQVEPVGFIP